MEIIDIHDLDILQRASDEGIINLETIEKQVRMQDKNKILRRHCFAIWQGKTNGKWYTYLPAPDKKNGRVQKERNSREEIENVIIEFYSGDSDAESKCPKSAPIGETLESLFPTWLRYKEQTGAAPSYLEKLYSHWKKYYSADIVSKDIKLLTCIELEIWAHQLIREFDMTKTEYYNATVIMRQILELAVQMNYISESPFKVKMDAKYFRKTQKKPDETQVFLITEQPKLEEACWAKYNKSPQYVSSLGILLAFRTGVRVGELVALKEEDISGDYIHVHREEIKDYKLEQEEGQLRPVYHGTIVVDHTKSEAGDRYIYLTPEAKHIIECIIESNRLYGNYNDGFLFVKGGKRILGNSMIKRLYVICEYAGIPQKSTHKIRKTFISGLIDGGVNINTIRKTVGHEKEATTYSNYCFDRRPRDVIESQFDAILDGTATTS